MKPPGHPGLRISHVQQGPAQDRREGAGAERRSQEAISCPHGRHARPLLHWRHGWPSLVPS
eukprot:4716274-Heterocapsa_arctica.AAC.1